MINLMQPFMPHVAPHNTDQGTAKKNNTFVWDSAVNQGFQWLKFLMASTFQKLFEYYDHSITITIQAYRSKRDLGTCLLQGEQPVSFTSKSFKDIDTHYVKISKHKAPHILLWSDIYICWKWLYICTNDNNKNPCLSTPQLIKIGM